MTGPGDELAASVDTAIASLQAAVDLYRTPDPVPPDPVPVPKNYDEVVFTGTVTADELRNRMAAPRQHPWLLVNGGEPHGFKIKPPPNDDVAHGINIPSYTVLAGYDTERWTMWFGSHTVSFFWDGSMMELLWPKFDSAGKAIGEKYGHPQTGNLQKDATDVLLVNSDIHDSTSSPLGNMQGSTKRITWDGLRVWGLDSRFGSDTTFMHQVPMGGPFGGYEDWTVRNFYLERFYSYWDTKYGSNVRIVHEDGWLKNMNPQPLYHRCAWAYSYATNPPKPVLPGDQRGGRSVVDCEMHRVIHIDGVTNDFPAAAVQDVAANGTATETTLRGPQIYTRPERIKNPVYEAMTKGWPVDWGPKPTMEQARDHPRNPAVIRRNTTAWSELDAIMERVTAAPS